MEKRTSPDSASQAKLDAAIRAVTLDGAHRDMLYRAVMASGQGAAGPLLWFQLEAVQDTAVERDRFDLGLIPRDLDSDPVLGALHL